MLKKIFCSLFGCMLSLCAVPVFSTSQPIAVITDTWGQMDGTLTIFFKQTILDLGPAGDQIPPQGWYVGIAGPMGYSSAHVGELNWIPGNYKTMADGKKTFAELAMYVYKDLNAKSVTQFHATNNSGRCLAYLATPLSNVGKAWNPSSYIMPQGCPQAPPSNLYCRFVNDQIELDHKTVTNSQVNGSTAQASLDVSCTSPSTVKFHLIGSDDNIYLQPSGQAKIQINNMPLNSAINLQSGNNSLILQDELSGIDREGAYSGSGVLIIELY
ncbi:hypothetical protein [Cronobacter dublinensis]|uniref:MrpH family fimbial adhesin n=1 Tax=Cronobacter dublinensis TaxID=413497 RepID=UPI00300E2D11